MTDKIMIKGNEKNGFLIAIPEELSKKFPINKFKYLTLEFYDDKKIILKSPPKESVVDKSCGILMGKVLSGVKFEDKIRRSAEKRLKEQGIK